MAMVVFLLFLRIPLRGGRWIGLLAPSMFSVYLLHCATPNHWNREMMHSLGDVIMSRFDAKCAMSEFVTCILVVVIVFAICVCLDGARRLCVRAFLPAKFLGPKK